MSGTRHGWHELDAMSNFSFLEGASHPEEMVSRAVALGYSSLGIADRCTAAGVVRAHVAAAREGLALRIGVRLDLHIGDAPHDGGGQWAGACDDAHHAGGSCSAVASPQSLEVIVYPCDAGGWGHLCALVTDGRDWRRGR